MKTKGCHSLPAHDSHVQFIWPEMLMNDNMDDQLLSSFRAPGKFQMPAQCPKTTGPKGYICVGNKPRCFPNDGRQQTATQDFLNLGTWQVW